MRSSKYFHIIVPFRRTVSVAKITTGIIIHDIYKYYKNKRKQKDIYVYMIYIWYISVNYILFIVDKFDFKSNCNKKPPLFLIYIEQEDIYNILTNDIFLYRYNIFGNIVFPYWYWNSCMIYINIYVYIYIRCT